MFPSGVYVHANPAVSTATPEQPPAPEQPPTPERPAEDPQATFQEGPSHNTQQPAGESASDLEKRLRPIVGALNLLLDSVKETNAGKDVDWDDALMRLLGSHRSPSDAHGEGKDMGGADREQVAIKQERDTLREAYNALSKFSAHNQGATQGLMALHDSIQLAAAGPSGLGEIAGAAAAGNLDRYSQALVLAGETDVLRRLWTKSQR